MPVEHHGNAAAPSQYDTAKCISWRIETEVRKANGERPQDWLAREQATSKAMDNAIRRGQLIPADQLEPKLRAAFIAAREYWRNEPTRLARDSVGKPIREIEELLAAAFDAFLVKLSHWPQASGVSQPGTPDQDDDLQDGAPA